MSEPQTDAPPEPVDIPAGDLVERDVAPSREDPVTTELMLSLGMSYRKLDYWTRCGWFSPPGERRPEASPTPGSAHAPGSGYARRWTFREYMIADLIVRLMDAGLELTRAGMCARLAVDEHVPRITTDKGITIAWAGSVL